MAKRKPSAKPPESAAAAKPDDAYARKKTREANRSRAKAEAARDLSGFGDIPPIDEKRRTAATKSFRVFCETYFPLRFPLAWSDDHLKVIAKLEKSCSDGGLFALAMPRGSGKTTLCEAAVLWVTLTGRRAAVALIGASKKAADEMLDSIKTEIETNEVLTNDFPEVCLPFQALEGLANRCKGQLYNGERTYIGYGKDYLIFPTIPGSVSSGCFIRVAGITGRVRGMKHRKVSGEIIRPSLVVIDDPQTEASARSPRQVAQRLRIVTAAILGLAGPGVKIAGVMPCTVIERGDMADQVLDRKKHPQWHGERCKLLNKFPDNMDLWREYSELRRTSLENGGEGAEATAFYAKRRKEMDAGSHAAWPARKKPDEISALQHAMNLYFDDEESFWSEYQNEPVDNSVSDDLTLTVDGVMQRLSRVPRGVVPLSATRLTAFADVQHKLLYWVVAAWQDDFTGWVVDYGTWPDQGRSHFTLRQAVKTLAKASPGRSPQEAVAAGAVGLASFLCGRDWPREDKLTTMRLDKLLFDGKDGTMTKVIADVCRTSEYRGQLLAASGKGIGPNEKPMHQYSAKVGEKIGDHWIRQRSARFFVPWLLVDTNHWKTEVATSLLAAETDKGAIRLFGERATEHRMFAEHVCSEERKRVFGDRSKRWVDQWTLRPGKSDNHWFDCLVGSAVAASVMGCTKLAFAKKAEKRIEGEQSKRPSRPRGGGGVSYF